MLPAVLFLAFALRRSSIASSERVFAGLTVDNSNTFSLTFSHAKIRRYHKSYTYITRPAIRSLHSRQIQPSPLRITHPRSIPMAPGRAIVTRLPLLDRPAIRVRLAYRPQEIFFLSPGIGAGRGGWRPVRSIMASMAGRPGALLFGGFISYIQHVPGVSSTRYS